MREAKKRLWIADDGETLVPDGDRRAAFLYCIPGQKLVETDRYKGLSPFDDKRPGRKKRPPEDKAVKQGEDK